MNKDLLSTLGSTPPTHQTINAYHDIFLAELLLFGLCDLKNRDVYFDLPFVRDSNVFSFEGVINFLFHQVLSYFNQGLAKVKGSHFRKFIWLVSMELGQFCQWIRNHLIIERVENLCLLLFVWLRCVFSYSYDLDDVWVFDGDNSMQDVIDGLTSDEGFVEIVSWWWGVVEGVGMDVEDGERVCDFVVGVSKPLSVLSDLLKSLPLLWNLLFNSWPMMWDSLHQNKMNQNPKL